MGVASSTLIMRQVEEGSKTERLKELSERFAFFQRWSLKDVKHSLEAYGGLPHAFARQPCADPAEPTAAARGPGRRGLSSGHHLGISRIGPEREMITLVNKFC